MAQRQDKMGEKKAGVEMSNFSSAPQPSTLQPTYVPPDSTLTPVYPSVTTIKSEPRPPIQSRDREGVEIAAKQPQGSAQVSSLSSLEKKETVIEKEVKLQSEVKEQKLKSAPEGAALDAVITKSTLVDRDSAKQAENIKAKFNEGRPLGSDGKPLSCFSTSIGGRGEYLNRDEFLLGHRNKVPELASFNKDYNTTMSVKADGTQIERINVFKHYDLFFGVHGVFVLNVPQDKFAKAMSGQQPLLFGPGPHVIKDPNFKFNPQMGLVSQSEPVISHGNLHVIRVPKGSFAKIWIGTEPYILDYREEPYVFSSPLFRMDKNGESFFFNVSEPVISHGTIHILRIPAGSYVKAWEGVKPILLQSRDEPYIIDSAQFRLERNGQSPFWDVSRQLINHGTITVIRVPAGSIAKVWEGSVPKLLEARDEPYIYDSALFRIEKNGEQYFFSTTEKLIEHGSIKRILPPINHEAIVSEGGNLVVFPPSKDGSPIILDSQSQKVEGFVDKSVQTVTFPSEKTIGQRQRDKKDHATYEVFRTKDSLEVGVTLLVGYQITDPKLAITTLGMNGIVTHIEHLANVDMNKAIQQSSSQEFLTFYQTKPHRDEAVPGGYGLQTAPPPQHYQDIVKKQLADDLRKAGIELTRLNIENPIILNKEIAKKMEEQSMLAAGANAQEAVLRQNYNIEIAKAEREAAIKKVVQDQANQSTLSAADAKLQAAKLEAEAKLVAARAEAEAKVIAAKASADAEANAKVVAAEADSKTKGVGTDAESKAILMKADADVKAIVMRAEADAKASLMKAEAEAKALADNPELMQMRMLSVKMSALQNIKFFPPAAGTLPPGMAVSPFGLFSQYSEDSAPAAIVEQKPTAPSLTQKKV